MKFSRSLSLLLVALCSSSQGLSIPATRSDDNSTATVDVGYATYQGVPYTDSSSGTNTTQFLGMRYAAPPTGPLRFAAPQAPATVEGVQVAGNQPNRCYMGAQGTASLSPYRQSPAPSSERRRATTSESSNQLQRRDLPPFDEDCLFLNVYVPGNLGDQEDLPVVFWIHGGGYVAGSAVGLWGGDAYDGNDLVREAGGGVIAVVIQYRLGAFGFLPGQKVKDSDFAVLNAGLLDQQFALQWVQQHISKFGGDPSKVTIWGQSAGAGSVIQHVVANGGSTNPPLFRAAIASSTFLPSEYKYNDPVSEMIYNQTVTQSGCDSAEDSLQCLRDVDVNTLGNANVAICTDGFWGTFVFSPVVDGTLITDRPTVLLKEGKLNGEALYSVTNAAEGDHLVDPTTQDTVTASNYLAQLFPAFGQTEIDAGVQVYESMGSPLDQAKAIMTDSIFLCPTYSLMRAFKDKAYKGFFAIPPAVHGDDLPYYFPNIGGAEPSYANEDFSISFTGAFLNFVISLDPNTKWNALDDTPSFPTWSDSNEMLFNKTESDAPDVRVIETSAELLKRCEYWDSVSPAAAQ